MTNPRIGSTFESFQREVGMYDEITAEAAARVGAWQLTQQQELADRDGADSDDQDCPAAAPG